MSGEKAATAFYVYSTLAADVDYRTFADNGANDIPEASEPLIVKGGTGIANDRIVTPDGVRSGPFTAEQAEILRNHYLFKLHAKNGFVELSTEKLDPEVAAVDMERRDNSAPIVPEDLKPTDAKLGAVGAATPKAEAKKR